MALAAVAVVCFVQGFLRLRRRGRRDHASWRRAALFAAGLALLVLPLVSPLDELGDRYLLSAHMLQHVLIADAAPALILVALRGPLLYFAVPAPALRAFGRARRLRRAPRLAAAARGWRWPSGRSPSAPGTSPRPTTTRPATRPSTSSSTRASSPPASSSGRCSSIRPRTGRLSPGRRLALALALLALGTVIADVLIFSPIPLYPAYAGQADRVFGLSPLRDQQLAGLVMIVEQLLVVGTFAATVLVPELRLRRAVPPRLGREQPA